MTRTVKPLYDAIIIGSGAGGSSLALRLAQHGLSVLVVDGGSFLAARRTSPSDPIGAHITKVMGGHAPARWPIGGQTKFYGAALYRMRVSDFDAVEHEGGMSPAWPISYWDIEPYYQEAEELYRVHGAQDGDPSEPPRAQAFPHPPLPHAPLIAKLVRRLGASGTPVAAIPRGIDYGPDGACVLCATCDAYHCRLDAKMDAEIAALRPALRTGKVQVATETECLRVLTDERGERVTGVVLHDHDGEHTVRAPTVAVSAGVQESVVLLRRSRTGKHPDGLGNDSGCLGRYLAGHSVGMIFPLLGWQALRSIHTKTFAINAYYDGAFDWPYPLGVIQAAGQIPFWEEASRPMRPAARLIGAVSAICFYMTEAIPTRETRLLFDGERLVGRVDPVHNLKTFDKLRRTARSAFRRAGYWAIARRQAPILWHPVGTARMGRDAATSVVDPNCQVHGIEGLFVVDASVLPSAGAVNTGLTIIAVALRAGDFISGTQKRPRAAARSTGWPI